MRADRSFCIRLLRVQTGLFLLGTFFSSTGLAFFPSLKELQPRGAQRGTAFKLTLVGSGLTEGIEVRTTLPASFTPLAAPEPGKPGQDSEQAIFLVELDPDAPIDLYPIRVITPTGMSNLLLFSVGKFREVQEEDDTGAGAIEANQMVEAPVTVNGTLVGPDRDVYRFYANRGDEIVLEVEGRRAGSALDPVLRLLDSVSRQLAFNDDAPGLGADPRIEFTVPADGEYQVVVHDARFSQQEQNFYRLKIGPITYAEGLFPLGWRRGEKASIEFLGGNLDAGIRTQVDLEGETRDLINVSLPDETGSLPLPFVVGDLPEVLEPGGEEQVRLDPLTVVNGRVSLPGEVDHYRLAVSPGEFWTVELRAATLGTSRLFGRITALDAAGKRLGSAGDEVPRENDFTLVVLGPTSPDPHFSFEVPPETHEVLISVEDLVGRGGPLFGYRLWARKEPPDFTLTLTTPYVNVPESGTGWVEVSVRRRGYHGQIQLDVPDAGPDLIVEGGMVGSEPDDPDTRSVIRTCMLSLTAQPGARPGLRQVGVRGRVLLSDGSVIERWAVGPGLLTEVAVGTGIPDPSLRMTEQPFSAPWLGLELPLMVTAEVPVRFVLESPSQVRLVQGMPHELKWRLLSSDPQISLPRKVVTTSMGGIEVRTKVSEGEEDGSGTVTLVTTIGTRPSKFNVGLAAEVEQGGRKHQVRSRSVTIEVVQGYRLVVGAKGFAIQPGAEAELAGRLERDPLFDQAVTIKPENFPRGVSCSSVEVPPRESDFRIRCVAEAWASPGEHIIELTSSSVLAGREKEKVPYSIPPVTAPLIISSAENPIQASGTR